MAMRQQKKQRKNHAGNKIDAYWRWRFLEEMRGGMTMAEAAEFIGVSRRYVERYRKTDPDFDQKVRDMSYRNNYALNPYDREPYRVRTGNRVHLEMREVAEEGSQ